MGPFRPFLIALLLTLASLATPALAAPNFPALSGRVVDAANILPPDVETRIDQKLAALETQSRRQLVVATIPDLQGYDIADYGYQLGRAWGIGSKEKNDGALLIVAPKDRKLRIEVGYGLEGTLTDGLSSLIINQTIVPQLKAGNMPGGIEAGVDAIVTQLSLPPEEAQKIAAQANQAPADSGDGWVPLVFFGFMFLSFFVLPMLRGGSGRRYRSGGFVPIVWDSGSGSGSGWGGGGGFSGGGGSFGGGGSSGSW